MYIFGNYVLGLNPDLPPSINGILSGNKLINIFRVANFSCRKLSSVKLIFICRLLVLPELH